MLRYLLLAFVLALPSVPEGAHAQGAPRPGCNGACGVIRTIVPVDERQVWTPLGSVTPTTISSNAVGATPTASAQMQFGSGLSRQGMVVIGAAGGAVYAQKPNEYRRSRWDVTLRMDDGSTRVVSMGTEPIFVQEGDYVRVSGNNLELVNP